MFGAIIRAPSADASEATKRLAWSFAGCHSGALHGGSRGVAFRRRAIGHGMPGLRQGESGRADPLRVLRYATRRRIGQRSASAADHRRGDDGRAVGARPPSARAAVDVAGRRGRAPRGGRRRVLGSQPRTSSPWDVDILSLHAPSPSVAVSPVALPRVESRAELPPLARGASTRGAASAAGRGAAAPVATALRAQRRVLRWRRCLLLPRRHRAGAADTGSVAAPPPASVPSRAARMVRRAPSSGRTLADRVRATCGSTACAGCRENSVPAACRGRHDAARRGTIRGGAAGAGQRSRQRPARVSQPPSRRTTRGPMSTTRSPTKCSEAISPGTRSTPRLCRRGSSARVPPPSGPRPRPTSASADGRGAGKIQIDSAGPRRRPSSRPLLCVFRAG